MSSGLHFFTLNCPQMVWKADHFDSNLTLLLLYKNGLYTNSGFLYIQKKVLKHISIITHWKCRFI